MPTISHVVSHPIAFKTSMLNTWLPSIKRDIRVPVHAGRIKGFIENWSLLTQDAWVLQVVQGLQLPLVELPTQELPPQELRFPVDQTELITAEVQELKSKGAISLVQDDTGGFISQIFIVPKKDGGYRPVINLRALNNYIPEEHFKMEGFHMVKDLIRPQDWLAKIDLKDAYLLVPIHLDHRKYLQFRWQSLTYQFNCLPFGLSCAPRVFTKLMKPVVAFLREKGIRLIIYLDDILVMCESQEELTKQVNLIQDLFAVLGLTINIKKSQLSPVQELVFLGQCK